MGGDSEWISAYRLVHKLGEGPGGRVYLARDPRSADPVVVRIMEAASTGAEETLRFVREGPLLARVEHPGFARILSTGSEGELLYIAAEFVPGPTFAEVLAHAAPDRQTRLAGLAQAAAGLAALHGAGLAHRDVEPGNLIWDPVRGLVLVDPAFGAHLTDWSIPRDRDQNAEHDHRKSQIANRLPGSPRPSISTAASSRRPTSSPPARCSILP